MDRSFHFMTRKSQYCLGKHLIALFALIPLVLSLLLLMHYLFHLFDRYCTFNVNPFVQNRMAVTKLQYQVDASNIKKRHKPEASRLLGPFVLQDNTVFNFAKVKEIILKLR